MSELHGNCYIENCNNPDCKAEYLRHFDVCAHHGTYFVGVVDKESKSGISHITGRVCDKCKKGILRDSIIHFGENLPEEALERATQNAAKSDVAFIMGTSLRVTPACDLPQMVKKNHGPMICVNLQATGKDPTILSSGGILIHAKCDAVMSVLLTKLGVEFTDTTQQEMVAELAKMKALAERLEKQAKDKADADKKKHEAWAKKAAADAAAIPGTGSQAAAAADSKTSAGSGGAGAGSEAGPAQYFWFGNTHTANPNKKDTNAHQWTVFVSESDPLGSPEAEESAAAGGAAGGSSGGANANKKAGGGGGGVDAFGATIRAWIEKVDIKLHPTFDPANITLRPTDTHGLTLTRLGWGTFIIPITIHFRSDAPGGARDPITVHHNLSFDPQQPIKCARLAVPHPKAGLTLMDALKNGLGRGLRPVDTKVTTITGASYIEKNAKTAGSGGSGSGGTPSKK